jgi:hypothetical protein
MINLFAALQGLSVASSPPGLILKFAPAGRDKLTLEIHSAYPPLAIVIS